MLSWELSSPAPLVLLLTGTLLPESDSWLEDLSDFLPDLVAGVPDLGEEVAGVSTASDLTCFGDCPTTGVPASDLVATDPRVGRPDADGVEIIEADALALRLEGLALRLMEISPSSSVVDSEASVT